MRESGPIHSLKDLIDVINTDGGHIFLALFLLFAGLVCLVHWHLAEGKELFVFALGVLGMAMKSTGRANGQTTTQKTVDTHIKTEGTP